MVDYATPVSELQLDPSSPLGRSELAQIMNAQGPFVSMYLPADSSTFDAKRRLGIHAANATKGLADHGFGEESVDRVMRAVVDLGHRDGATVVIIATPHRLLLAGHLADPMKASTTYGSLPNLVPLLDSEQRSIPHVVAITDRIGADVFMVSAPGASDYTTVSGQTEFIHRGAPGGWSQRRFQQRAENTWEANAKLVAQEVAHACREAHAQLLVIAGDERAVGFMREALPTALAPMVVEVDGGRAKDGGLDELAGRVNDAVASKVAERRAAYLRELADGRGRDQAVAAVEDVLAALRRRAVKTLYLSTGAGQDDERVWFSHTDPVLTSRRSTELEDLGIDHADIEVAPLSAVGLRAALAGGSEVCVVPHSPSFSGSPVAVTLRVDLH